MSGLVQAAYFILLLGGLVFFHELGHFVAAKLCRVKVLKFSLGFGPRVWGFTRGETEYQLAALPLGGFVRMLGEDPNAPIAPEDRGRSFAEQRPLRRAFIAFAGPAVNLLLPPLVFFGMNMVPQPQAPAVVGQVIRNEAADRAGIQPGDQVVSVDGLPTRSFDEMREAIEARALRPIDIVVIRDGERKTLRVTPTSETEHSLVDTTHKGKIGIMGRLASYVGVVPGSRAFDAGLRTFDHVVGLNGEHISSVVDLHTALRRFGQQSALTFQVVRDEVVDLKTSSIATANTMTITVPAGAAPLGLDNPDLYVREIVPGSRAASGGLQPLDKVVGVDGKPVYSQMRLWALIDGRKSLSLDVERNGQKLTVPVEAVQIPHKSKLLGTTEETSYGFDFHPGSFQPEPLSPADQVMISYPPMRAAERAIDQSVGETRTMLLGIGALFTGRVPKESIMGPIGMYQLTGAASEQGFLAFMSLFALISMNLGLMNLLPVPVLDGFHIVLAAVEGISRRVVPIRVREAANWVGVVMLLALMLLAFKNDIWRVLGM